MKITLLTLIGLSLILFVITGCMSFRTSDKGFQKEMSKSNMEITIHNDTFENETVRYLSYQKDSLLPTLIFIHGAPGSSSAFSDYIKDTALNQYYNIMVVDRLGYGYSSYGKFIPLDKQADWIASLAKTAAGKVFLIGHSFGGPIAARAAFKAKDKITGTVMIAPALDPDNEKYFFGGKLAYWKATRWMFSGAWKVSASEKYNHANELKMIVADWKNITTPVFHIHGSKDKLVPYINLSFSKKHFSKDILETYSWEEKGHLIPFTEAKETIKLIKSFVNKH